MRIIEGQGNLIHKLPSTPFPIISVPFSSTNIGCTPGKGNVAKPGFVLVIPAIGEINIPYGGIAYNKKNFRQKVELIFSDYIKGLFGKASFSNLDFADFLNQFSPTKDDFVFLDPPYDSEFSEYDHNVFTKNDQIRLRDAILKCKGKCMVVIKETEFIKELYNHLKFSIIDFDKMYTYIVRGRNNRGTKHLIILNYKISLARY